MIPLLIAIGVVAVPAFILLSLTLHVVQQHERGVLFQLGKVGGTRDAGLTLIIPVIDRLERMSLRIVTMPSWSRGIITRDNASIDVTGSPATASWTL